MNLDEIKVKRLTEGKKADEKKGGIKKVRRLPTGTQVYANEADDASDPLVEGEKKHETPKFVQHCVAAITSDPQKLAKVQARKDGSPFGICVAQYKKNPRTLAAKHAQGEHHTVKEYEKALKKLRESVEHHAAQNTRPSAVFFDPLAITEEASSATETIRFKPTV